MNITTLEELDLAIEDLKHKRIEKKNLILSHIHDIKESIKPINILKSSLHGITAPGDVRSTLIKAAGGIGVGLLTKGILNGGTTSAIGSMLSNTLKSTITSTLYNNTDKLKAYGLAIYHNIFRKKQA